MKDEDIKSLYDWLIYCKKHDIKDIELPVADVLSLIEDATKTKQELTSIKGNLAAEARRDS